MRRLAAATLAVPVIASIYLGLLVTVPAARRYAAGVLAIVVVGAVGIALAAPAPATSIPPTHPTALAADLLQPIETGLAGSGAPDSTTADGQGAVSGLTGSDNGADATAAPDSAPENVPSPVLQLAANNGQTSSSSVTGTASVRAVTTATVAGTKLTGKRVRLDTGIVLRFNRAVSLSAVKRALAISPAIKGTVKATTAGKTAKSFVFTPATPLRANTAYTIRFAKAIKDAEGVAVAAPKPIRLMTAAAPALVRFRPSKGATEIDPTQVVSVRFNRAMNRSATAKAFSVVVNGRRVAGKITWAESDTVLVFTPARPFVKGMGVGVRLLGTARSTDGVPIKKGGSVTFKVVPGAAPVAAKVTTSKPVAKPTPKPVSRPTPKPVSRPTPKPRPPSGGGSLGGGSWAAAERYYLSLMNCTRTGGFVTSSGSCSSPGGRGVRPLWIDAGISARVSRPYAKYLATTGMCSHFANGSPGRRLSRAGYHSSTWAENISCPKTMSVMPLMVYTQQYFQAERSYNGGHYRNLMNAAYDRVGIGVWVAHGRAEIVIDFYHP